MSETKEQERWVEQLRGKRWSFRHTENDYKLCQDDNGELMPVVDHEATLAEVNAGWKQSSETIARFHERNPPLAIKERIADLQSQLTAAQARIAELEDSLRQSVEHGAAGWNKFAELTGKDTP